MGLESFLEHYGYVALLIGTFLEGETVLVLGGLAAQRGYLQLALVILSAFIGTLFGDQLFFFIGRRHAQLILSWRPSWSNRMKKANQLLERYQWPVLIGFRFLYGLRTIIPFSIGLSKISARRFFLLNLVGAFVWASLVGSGGYLFGHALEALIGNIKRYEVAILIIIASIGILVWLIHFVRRKHRAI